MTYVTKVLLQENSFVVCSKFQSCIRVCGSGAHAQVMTEVLFCNNTFPTLELLQFSTPLSALCLMTLKLPFILHAK